MDKWPVFSNHTSFFTNPLRELAMNPILTQIKISVAVFLLSIIPFAYAGTQPNDAAIERAILVHINEYRQNHGLSKLTMDAKISQEARVHSQDMAVHRMPFGHIQFKKRIDHLHAHIKNSNAGAENVAYNYKGAQDVVNNWVKSPGHKANIVGNYNLTGIGIARDAKGKIYFTQMFLKTGGQTRVVHPSLSNLITVPFFHTRRST
jgi:uncharacterized protein YkwD